METTAPASTDASPHTHLTAAVQSLIMAERALTPEDADRVGDLLDELTLRVGGVRREISAGAE